jgi:hypothetical protein
MARGVSAASRWAVADESSEAGSDHRSFVDRRLVAFLEVAQQPAGSEARARAWPFSLVSHTFGERDLHADRPYPVGAVGGRH